MYPKVSSCRPADEGSCQSTKYLWAINDVFFFIFFHCKFIAIFYLLSHCIRVVGVFFFFLFLTRVAHPSSYF